MQIIRPIKSTDFSALKKIAIESGAGFTSLPVNDDLLLEKINRSERSTIDGVKVPGDESYLFVLEDSQTGEVLGTTAIEAAVGLNNPLYHYHKGISVHHSRELGVYNTVETLTMCNDYTGSSEICTLFLRENYRKGYAGKLLSTVRFLFMAEHPERFSNTVIAEMRGVSDEQGHSPFWEWLQEHFFSIDFPTADHLIGVGNKGFISELMPKHPIYSNLLSEAAQNVISKVHEKTKPALRLLEKEGFEHRGYIDLFDAGPTVESKLSKINSVKNSIYCQVRITSDEQALNTGTVYLICNTSVVDFRATHTTELNYDAEQNIITISLHLSDALKVTDGENVRFINLT